MDSSINGKELNEPSRVPRRRRCYSRSIKVDYEHPHLPTTMPGNRENTI